MPKLWSQTIQEHRRDVRDSALDATASLVAERGLLAVTMSHIAEATGIARATLYKYFPDVEAILVAWHDRHVGQHLERLADIRQRAGDHGRQLEAVLEAYALITYERPHHTELEAVLHRGKHAGEAHQRLNDLVCGALKAAADGGQLRTDVPPEELASYCLNALAAARTLPSKAAVQRLVSVTLAGLRP